MILFFNKHSCKVSTYEFKCNDSVFLSLVHDREKVRFLRNGQPQFSGYRIWLWAVQCKCLNTANSTYTKSFQTTVELFWNKTKPKVLNMKTQRTSREPSATDLSFTSTSDRCGNMESTFQRLRPVIGMKNIAIRSCLIQFISSLFSPVAYLAIQKCSSCRKLLLFYHCISCYCFRVKGNCFCCF